MTRSLRSSRRHCRLAAAAACGLVAMMLAPAAASTQEADLDCEDFSSQAEAQRVYLTSGGPKTDIHYLDVDGNGLACELNPAPYRGLLTLKHKKGKNFTGTLRAVVPECVSGRPIQVHRGKVVVATAMADAAGAFSVRVPKREGKFFATTTAFGDCLDDRSRIVRVKRV